MLRLTVESYLRARRAVGFRLRTPEILLRSFVRFASRRGQTHVCAQTAIEWAALGSSPGQRDRRLKTVIHFARYIHAEDHRHEVPPDQVFGPPPQQRRTPFIFSAAEIRQLVAEAHRLGPTGSLRPYTYGALFSLLTATGLRISEALALRLDDITADGLLIRETKFKKNRLVPLHGTAEAGIERYLVRRRRLGGTDDHVFVSLRGRAICYPTVFKTFRKLIVNIGLQHSAGRPRPHIHSLRHTFAVRALETSPGNAEGISQHMLALSTYLGHTHVEHTYWYLEATPNLSTNIAQACEALVCGRAK